MFKTLENKYILLLWWALFMFILPWDQEKVVIVNLVVFCYVLHYIVSKTVEDIFNQKKLTIQNAFTRTANSKICHLKFLENEIRRNTYFVNLFICVALNEFKNVNASYLKVKKNNSFLNLIINSNKNLLFLWQFRIINIILYLRARSNNNIESNKTFLTIQIILANFFLIFLPNTYSNNLNNKLKND